MVCSDCVGHSENCIDPVSSLDYIKSAGGCPFPSNTCKPCQVLPDLEKEIKQATDRFENLLSRHRALRTQVNHRHSAIIRDFPVEILCKIFQECIPVLDDLFAPEVDPEYRHQGPISEIDLPLKLGAVCRTWRQIAWSTQNLWTRICVKLSGTHIDEPTHYNVLEEWIPRSGRLPLEVYIWERAPDSMLGKVQGSGMKCLQAVAQCADRWRDLDVDLENKRLRYLFSQAAEVTRSFELRKFVCTGAIDNMYVHGLRPDTGALLETWPHFVIKPQQVILRGCWPGRTNHLDWSGVTHIWGTWWTRDAWLNVFQQAPHLVFCELKAEAEQTSANAVRTPSSGRQIRLEHLQQLFVKAWTGKPGRTLDFFAAPRLQEFNYLSRMDTSTLLTSFLRRSRCSLTRLNIRTESFTTTASLISFLDQAPSLEELAIDIPVYHTTSIIKSLFQRCLESITFLPSLESLTCDGGRHFPWDLVPHVFGPPSDFRIPGKRQLKSLVVTETAREDLPRIAQDVVVRLLELRNAGAAITYNLEGQNFENTMTLRWEDCLQEELM
ncbi:hypothetical protein D9613_004296 [Agrocybe pediades]|uniref:F-box domain-containing protein n=1 Tax=Agrocybe pediades TaxID=84607 RepID=A0A8H4VJY1_9AGAR|nr:hypothetical protein D9613_004296 [Agrocybe pediades]